MSSCKLCDEGGAVSKGIANMISGEEADFCKIQYSLHHAKVCWLAALKPVQACKLGRDSHIHW